MNTNQQFPFIIMIALAFTGCSKGTDPTPVKCYILSSTEVVTVSSTTNTNTTTYSYDKNNKIVTETIGTASGTNTINYTYDSKGNVSTMQSVPSGLTTFAYDTNNRLIAESFNAGGAIATYSYTYNSNGQRTTTTGVFANISITYSYPNGTTKNYSQSTTIDGGWTTVVTYEYDNRNNPERLGLFPSIATDNNVTKITSSYMGGAPQVRTVTYQYNSDGFPVSMFTAGNLSSITRTTNYDCK